MWLVKFSKLDVGMLSPVHASYSAYESGFRREGLKIIGYFIVTKNGIIVYK